nr:mechanosensitive ion channel domain-containing protein [Haloplanus sp. XH21]
MLARAVRVIFSAAADRFVERGARLRLAIPLMKFLIYGAAIYTIVGPLFQVSQTQALAFAGVFGAALGFGLKDFFANVLGGIVVSLEMPYQMGDRVEIDDHYGEVIDVGVRATRLQTPDDNVVAVPNYLALTGPVSNANTGAPEMMVVTELHVAPEADLDRARAIVEEAVSTSRHLAADRSITVLVEDHPRYRTVRAKAYVTNLDAEFAFKSDVTRRALRAFDAEGIPTPSPMPWDDDGPGA